MPDIEESDVLATLLGTYGTQLNTAGAIKRPPPMQMRYYTKLVETVALLSRESEPITLAFLAHEGVVERLVVMTCASELFS